MFYSFYAVALSKVCVNDTQSITVFLIHQASQCILCFELLRGVNKHIGGRSQGKPHAFKLTHKGRERGVLWTLKK